MFSEEQYKTGSIVFAATNMHAQTSLGGAVGAGAGTATVVVVVVIVVETTVVVVVAVEVTGCVVVPVDICVVVTVAGGFSPPSPPCRWFSLCCAPANKPMKIELRSSRSRSRMRRILVRGDRGSCTAEENRSANEGFSGCLRVSSGEATLWRRGAVSGSAIQTQLSMDAS